MTGSTAMAQLHFRQLYGDDIKFCEDHGETYEEACAHLKKRYDGYYFRQNGVGIYNPFSVLSTFNAGEYGSYWFETGTPSFLVELLKRDYLITLLLGLYVGVEHTISDGRIDMIAKTRDYIYIFEFKYDKSADEALKQIDEKGYARPFAMDRRKLFKVGVNFSRERRCIGDWKVATT